MMKAAATLLAGVLGVAAFSVHAATREELRREREAIEAEHARRAEACKSQFVVTPCLDRVRIEKQKALSGVAAQENALDAAERQARADARSKRLADKAATVEGAASAAAATPSEPSPGPAPRKTPKPRQKKAEVPDRSAQEEAKRADFEARQREIEAHRQKVEERNAERARNKPAPRPLPPPASASSR
ncbi:hypothetical protein [Piscinibacter gummiphilus]|uniref:Uncharacterized protein n=1 Tax=Piscinibacter gummiphilus TaxID=946333 RepID=A0ABZ0D083_9BURK|nr:hypothetical protein [Piscinibacter gummiphilus]WOB10660.1 hypothetical protein RXV79_11520 [Piscinibacter gummiphilus]